MSTETNILLPTSSVDIFVKDKETLESARSLVDDWRFARVNLSVEEGDVETAILSYEEADSPNLVIIETDTTDESFVERLESLSAHCSEHTNAIVIGPVNDVNLYRSLTSMGVSDYLVKSVPLDVMSEVIANSLIKTLGTSGSRLIAIIGSKGGVGTSALTQAFCYGLSDKLDQKTFLMDAAGGWSTLSVGMGFEPSTNLPEAVRAAENGDEDTLARMIHSASDKLNVLASGADPMLETSVTGPQYEELIDLLMTSYPVVVVDLSGAIPSLKRTVLSIAHEIVVVTTPTLPALRATRTLLQEIKMIHGGSASPVDLVINMEGMMPSKEVPQKDIEEALEHKPTAVIAYDPKLFIGSENEGTRIVDSKGGSEIVSKLLPLAEKVVNGVSSDEELFEDDNILNQIISKVGLNKVIERFG